jgi:hypothetical protein
MHVWEMQHEAERFQQAETEATETQRDLASIQGPASVLVTGAWEADDEMGGRPSDAEEDGCAPRPPSSSRASASQRKRPVQAPACAAAVPALDDGAHDHARGLGSPQAGRA